MERRQIRKREELQIKKQRREDTVKEKHSLERPGIRWRIKVELDTYKKTKEDNGGLLEWHPILKI